MFRYLRSPEPSGVAFYELLDVVRQRMKCLERLDTSLFLILEDRGMEKLALISLHAKRTVGAEMEK